MKIAIIGAGNMGSAVARGILTHSSEHTLCISNPSKGKLEVLQQEFPQLCVTTNNKDAVEGADLIILAVKPWLIPDVIEEVGTVMDYKRQMLASLAGGVSLADLESFLPQHGNEECPTLCRVMPNTAIALGSSMTFLSTAYSTPEKDDALFRLFSIMGQVMHIKEALMPAATSLASCGIAFALRYVRAAMEGGVELGFRPEDAQRIICQTLQGTVDLLSQPGAHPEAEIDKVTTPGGLTICGLNAMEECGFTHSVQQGLRASIKK